MRTHHTILPLLSLAALCSLHAASPITRIPLPGDGGWDYLTADPVGRRLYVSHGTCVQVVDLDSRKQVGEISPTPGVHGIALETKSARGFITNGADSTVTVFDTGTLAKISTLKAGKKPDAVMFEPFTGRLFTMNGDSEDASAFDAATGKALGTIPLGGGPEFAVSDGKGKAYVNIEDKAELVRFDPAKLAVTARWSLAPDHTPTGLAYDDANNRLLSVCRSKHIVVLDAATGSKVATLPIGAGVDAIAIDSARRRAFVSCGDGTVSVVAWTAAGEYSIVGVIETEAGAKTLAYDAKTSRLFLSAAKHAPLQAGEKRAKTVPGSFAVLVVDVSEYLK